MKYWLITLFVILVQSRSLIAQDSPKSYLVGESGCYAWFPSSPGNAESSYSMDSSLVYTMTAYDLDGSEYSLILISLKEELADEDVDPVMISYLDYLQEQFGVIESDGYIPGYPLPSHANMEGIADVWLTLEDDVYVCAYGEKKILAVMLVFSGIDNEVSENSRKFFQSFRFPGD